MPGNQTPSSSYLTQIRNVTLLPKERVEHLFSPEEGLVREPPVNGKLLVTTNLRILSFSQRNGFGETSLVPIEELKGVTLKNGGGRSPASLLQGGLVVAVGIGIYLALAYWLAGWLRGPSVPFINIDVGPLLVLVIIAGGLWTVGRFFFSREQGSVNFQGFNWTFVFPYQGERASRDIYRVVNDVFAERQLRDRLSLHWED